MKWFFICMMVVLGLFTIGMVYKDTHSVMLRDYQLDVSNGKHHNILYTLYDGNRVVGTVNSACSLDSLVEFDNQ